VLARGREIEGTNLALARNLTQEQIMESLGDGFTLFPQGSRASVFWTEAGDGEPQLDDDRSAHVLNVATRGRGGTMSWLVGGGTRCRRCRNSSRSCGALQNVARFSHNILLDLLLRQPRRGAKREDGDCQYLDLASVIVLVSELDISALLPASRTLTLK